MPQEGQARSKLEGRVYENANEVLILLDSERGAVWYLSIEGENTLMTRDNLDVLGREAVSALGGPPRTIDTEKASVERHASVLLVRIPKHEDAVEHFRQTPEPDTLDEQIVRHDEAMHYG